MCYIPYNPVLKFLDVAQVVLASALDPFLSLRALASYSCVSVRKLRECLADSVHPLPHYRLGGKIIVRRSEFDAWMAAYRRVRQAEVVSRVVWK